MTKILLIEDEDAIREELFDWLQFEGYAVVEAANGRLGLAAAEEHLPDLIICDIRMPEMDGYTTLLEVRANPRLSHIPFIFLTASATRESFRKGMNLGADDYLTKPFTHGEIMSIVRSRLEKQRQMQQTALEQIAALEQALAAEKDKRVLKAQMMGMFSHEFRNPLTIILFNTQLIQHYGSTISAESQAAKLQQIAAAAEQLNRMLDNMIFTAKIESGFFVYTPEPTDTVALVEQIAHEFREGQAAQHEIQLALAVPRTFRTDATLLRHILINLISNAIKYSPAQTAIRVTMQLTNHWLEISVQDKGIGIPEADLPGLFEPFYRAKNAAGIKGTGLGLNIVKQAVDLCQGTIRVQSQEGLGSTFTISLPDSPPE